jgi:hypothetical protein
MSNRRTIIKIQRRGENKVYAGRSDIDHDALFENVARAVIAEMFSTRMANTLRITIKFRAGIRKDCLGVAYSRDLSKSTTARSKHYTIEIYRDMVVDEQIRVLIHELQHIEQYASGRLAVRTTYKVPGDFWRPVGHKGAAIKFPFVRSGGGWEQPVSWSKRPWEVEARAAEGKYQETAVQAMYRTFQAARSR